jgi:hypothetical protein
MYLEHHTVTELYSNVRMAQLFIGADALLHTHTHTHTHTHIRTIMLCSIIFIILAGGEDVMQLVIHAAIIFNYHKRKELINFTLVNVYLWLNNFEY